MLQVCICPPTGVLGKEPTPALRAAGLDGEIAPGNVVHANQSDRVGKTMHRPELFPEVEGQTVEHDVLQSSRGDVLVRAKEKMTLIAPFGQFRLAHEDRRVVGLDVHAAAELNGDMTGGFGTFVEIPAARPGDLEHVGSLGHHRPAGLGGRDDRPVPTSRIRRRVTARCTKLLWRNLRLHDRWGRQASSRRQCKGRRADRQHSQEGTSIRSLMLLVCAVDHRRVHEIARTVLGIVPETMTLQPCTNKGSPTRRIG